jgi:Family of unknown function (DUF6459)
MDDSPSDADPQAVLLLPYPYLAPDGTERPLPDPMAIRLVPVPNCLPPYDDELPGWRNPVGQVKQSWAADAHGPAPLVAHESDESAAGPDEPSQAAQNEPRTTRHDHTENEGAPAPAGGPPSPAEEAPPPAQTSPGPPATPPPPGGRRPRAGNPRDDIGPWPSQFAQVLAETLAGARPASQLTPWTTEQARAHIRRLGPLLAVDRRPRVQRVRASQPAKDVVEVAVIAEFGCRTHALAARLERAGARPATPGRPSREARWLCTAIESA